MWNSIIFDLDGVIVHTDQYHYQAWKAVADQINIHFDKEINHRLRGVSRKESLNIILEDAERQYSEVEKSVWMDWKNDYYQKLLNSITSADVSEEVQITLQVLKDSGYKLAIGSSSRNARLILEKTGLVELFNAISDGTI